MVFIYWAYLFDGVYILNIGFGSRGGGVFD